MLSNNHISAKAWLLPVSQMDEAKTIQIQPRERKYVLELKHMKQGSALVLAIHKLRVSDDESFDTIINKVKDALQQYKNDLVIE